MHKRFWRWPIALAIPLLLGPNSVFACPLCGDAAGGQASGMGAIAVPLLVAGGIGFVMFRSKRSGR